jgi:hypothetical protein
MDVKAFGQERKPLPSQLGLKHEQEGLSAAG